jgi:hypothetical protein
MKTIFPASHKGGCAKTTTARTLAIVLSRWASPRCSAPDGRQGSALADGGNFQDQYCLDLDTTRRFLLSCTYQEAHQLGPLIGASISSSRAIDC